MDRLLETYDQHVSPVLGGNDTGRQQQKRRRHLEAWLWSRAFAPLLPLEPPTAAAIAQGDAALRQKLCNAGLSKKAGRIMVHGAFPCQCWECFVSANKRVLGKRRQLMTLRCGKRSVKVLPEYFSKLKKLHDRRGKFHQAAFLVLARYRILQVHEKGGGNQGAIPAAVFAALRDWAKPIEPIEAFASPLNTLAGQGGYHSAFGDTDGFFGSRGSFFESQIQEGVVEVNPPFDEALVLRTADVCQRRLEAAAAGKKALVFLIIIPETDWPGHRAFEESKFKKWSLSLPSGHHFYQVGNQHVNHQRTYPASRNTTVLLLASKTSFADPWDLRQKIDEAFRRP
ncbi:mRNA (2'-O-methyladenosine-N(6)-)-methyltransferase (Cap-specific adenosine methyltransferase) (CAPAM) (hCAPAM) (Phosphorylated CTD-interacting factor 1) (hPCIF1) (Protein phosphatase 1 regulatory subunit 121) [Durusdinium trenchii]|uniref:PCIF1 WW domain-containing protein n=1 Tax=Durusdinium trenchii TaxID=1381693 RepID=A0ABP0HZK4_9DINO